MGNQTIQPLGVVPERISEVPIVLQGRLSESLQKLLALHPKRDAVTIVDMRSANRVIEYCTQDQVISVEAGITLKQLNEVVEPNHQQFPCTMSEESTILEVINNGDIGSLDHAFALRSTVLGLEVVLANGKTIKTGGKVVKNVTGYDLTKLFVGARGTFGIPVKAHLRLYAKQECLEVFIVSGLSIERYVALSNRLLSTGLPIAAMDFVHNVTPTRLPISLPQTFLSVAVSEHRQIMDELKQMFEKFFAQESATVQTLEDTDAEAFLLNLGSMLKWDGTTLELTIPRSQFQTLYEGVLNACNSALVHYRPGSCRLAAKGENAEQLQKILGAIRVFARSQPLAVAYSDDQFEYKVERLPDRAVEVDKIVQSIKNKFDPENRMNPFVRL